MAALFIATFWDTGVDGCHEFEEAYDAPSMRAALSRASDDAELLHRTTGTAWVLVSLVDARFNSEEALQRVASI